METLNLATWAAFGHHAVDWVAVEFQWVGVASVHGCLQLTEQQLEKPFEGLLHRSMLKALIGASHSRDIVITSRGGVVGSKWEHPDVVAVSIHRHLSVAMPQLRLIGFELKTQKGFNTDSIYQAFSYTRFLHESYVVVCHEPGEVWTAALPEYLETAQSLGVGLIRFNCERVDDDSKIEARARRFVPEPQRVDDFINLRMSGTVDWIKQEMKP